MGTIIGQVIQKSCFLVGVVVLRLMTTKPHYFIDFYGIWIFWVEYKTMQQLRSLQNSE
jgi:hypothetical protein